MVMMLLADREIHESEKSMMKDLYRQLVDSDLSDKVIDEEIENCRNSAVRLEDNWKDLLAHLNETGREIIIKVAYWMSIADGKFGADEEKLLRRMSKFFGISETHLKGIMTEIDETAST